MNKLQAFPKHSKRLLFVCFLSFCFKIELLLKKVFWVVIKVWKVFHKRVLFWVFCELRLKWHSFDWLFWFNSSKISENFCFNLLKVFVNKCFASSFHVLPGSFCYTNEGNLIDYDYGFTQLNSNSQFVFILSIIL